MCSNDIHSIRSMDCYNNNNYKYDIISKSRPELMALNSFLSKPNFETELKSPNSFIIDQQYGKTYAIPFGDYNHTNTNKSASYLISEFFKLLEACRCANILVHFSEKQSFEVTYDKIIASADTDADVTVVSDSEFLETEFDFEYTAPKKEQISIRIDKSCIEFDFDIYLNEKKEISNDFIFELISIIADTISQIIDLRPNNEAVVQYHIAVLGKTQRQISTSDSVYDRYGPCWKESFHVRIFIKVDKDVKRFIRSSLLLSSEFRALFKELSPINNIDEIFDSAATTNPAMFLGSAKRNASKAHEFKKLFLITSRKENSRISISKCKDFNPIIKTNTIGKNTVTNISWAYNLCYELSLNFESPGGLIKKHEYSVFLKIKNTISLYSERTENGHISDFDLRAYEDEVTSIAVRDFEASYVSKVLDIIARHRAITYDTWKIIIMALARRNKNYKPIAILFSLRYAQSFIKGGNQKIDELFSYVESNPIVNGKEPITVATLYYWARQDNPSEFELLQEYNMYHQLKIFAFQNAGRIGDTQLAEALKKMFGHKFICDENKKSLLKGTQNRIWREFVFSDDDHESGELYKWRSEKYPDTLHNYICKKLPIYIQDVINDCEQHKMNIKESEESNKIEEDLKYLEIVKKGIGKTISSLRSMSRINSIIKACEVEFRIGRRGFESSMDNNPNFIGVVNGVLKLYPETELIQRYHEIPISKHATVEYVPYDPNNSIVKMLENELLTIFAGNRETYEFWMMILASGLDSREKNPQYLCIWEGCGAQGKSVISELDSNTLGLSGPECSGGYATKMDVSYFCRDRKNNGPDSAISATKKVRRIWCAETESGAQLRMGQIKEILSEKITGNEKHEKQDVWKVNSHIMITTNHEIRIIGRDYGTWRRIIFQKFKMMFLDKNNKLFDPNNKYHKECNPKIMDEWVSDIKFRQAYLSILVHYYEILRDTYSYNFRKIPRTKIDKYTQEYEIRQDTISQFIYTRIIYIGETYIDGSEVSKVPIVNIVSLYTIWHTKTLGIEKFNLNDIQNYLRAHRNIQSYIEIGISDNYLTKHRVLAQGENYADIEYMIPECNRKKSKSKTNSNTKMPIVISDNISSDKDNVDYKPSDINFDNIVNTVNTDINESKPDNLSTITNTLDNVAIINDINFDNINFDDLDFSDFELNNN